MTFEELSSKDQKGVERIARQIAAWKMGLVKDRLGERLPDDLWRQAIPAAMAECSFD